MTSFYDEVDIDEMEFDEDSCQYVFPCPCGDQFLLSLVLEFPAVISLSLRPTRIG